MKKRYYLLIASLLVLPLINANASSEALPGTANYDAFKNAYTKHEQITVNSSATVTIYAEATCTLSPKTCSLLYQGGYETIDDALIHNIVCANGEKNIVAQDMGSACDSYNDTNDANYDNEEPAYCSSDFYITCTSSSSGNNTLGLDSSSSSEKTTQKPSSSGGSSGGSSSGSSSSGSTSSGGSSSSGSSSSSSGSGSKYEGSSAEKSPQTGVGTYYIVLGVVAILAYSLMLVVKKFNLFKKL